MKSSRLQNSKTNEELKQLVKKNYSLLALNSDKLKNTCCCGTNPAKTSNKYYTIMSEDYSHLKGYEPDADLGVGCGIPTKFAGIQKGDTVVDLGSGAGNDCFVARNEVGESGRVIGIDFSPEMIAKAQQNKAKLGYKNISFMEGDIEDMPLENNFADVVISNCVINLLPEKNKIFKEIFRVLKPGGHFCVSDVVLEGRFPIAFTDNASLYAGCIASAMQQTDYIGEIENANFRDIIIHKKKRIQIPEEVLETHLDQATIQSFHKGNIGIYSITVTAHK
ncbi:MAG: arsenite methyltransferase [Bacteroidales bacterium]|nr:arsenite methyltransferase [Bacteroidales bacterium]